MNNKFLVFLIFITLANAKSDFYHSFIDKNLLPISQQQQKIIQDGSKELATIKRYIKENDLSTALTLIETFKNKNSIKMLQSEVIMLECDILYKLKTKTKALQAIKILQDAINSSQIDQSRLLDAYRLLVLLEVRINKLKDAQYYAVQISKIFDNPTSKVYGKVALAQIYMKQRMYPKAIRILKKELINTDDLEVATIIADELYDAYILNKQNEEAYDLIKKVLKKNIGYYANDPYKALTKIEKLKKAKMYDIAIEILESLVKQARKEHSRSIDKFRLILANTYMDIAGFQPQYMPKARAIYEDLIAHKKENKYWKKAKMYLDEIIMRHGKFDPSLIAAKYSTSESMQQKVMMQELLNALKNQQFEQLIRLKKIYSDIDIKIVNRFGYKNIEQIYDTINFRMIKYYLSTKQCDQLYDVMKDVRDSVLISLTKDPKSIDNMFGCMLDTPLNKTYQIAKRVYRQSFNGKVLLYLERVALELKKYKDALVFSNRIDTINDGTTLSKEFLYRFVLYGNLNNNVSMEKFFDYARKNQEFITNNQDNPIIIDFYYQYYLYLLKIKEDAQALEVLYKLYDKQLEMEARVYSPFVELELAKYALLDDNYKKSLFYLKKGLNIKRIVNGKIYLRKISKKDQAEIYYKMAKIYEHEKKINRYKASIKRCKSLKNVESYYKKMCDNL